MPGTRTSQHSPSYNRGEWAELYVLAKVLCERKISIQVHGNAEHVRDLAVLQVQRGKGEGAEEFRVEVDRVSSPSGRTLDQDKLCKLVGPFLDTIKKGKGSFAAPQGNDLLHLLQIKQLKRDSKEKTDIFLNVQDPLTGISGLQGYTVKALLGSKPTLFNASVPTNFTFRIDPPLTIELIDQYNEIDSKGKRVHGLRNMVSELLAKNYRFEFVDIDERFRDNLVLLDGEMPSFLSQALIAFYSRSTGKVTAVSAITDALIEANPLKVKDPQVLYPHKIKDFLEATAYGMVPTERYEGKRTASGGLLVVERNGELKCFRLDDRDRSRDFLFEHTYFDTGSWKRHRFGMLENIDGETRVKLNLQVRYK